MISRPEEIAEDCRKCGRIGASCDEKRILKCCLEKIITQLELAESELLRLKQAMRREILK